MQQQFDKAGTYTVKEDIKIKHVLTLIDSKTKKEYPIIATAIIPKESTVIVSKIYAPKIEYDYSRIDNGLNKCRVRDSDEVMEMKNMLHCTNKIKFTNIKRRNIDDTCYYNESILSGKKYNFKENIVYTFDTRCNREFIFTLDDDCIQADYRATLLLYY